MDRLNFSDLEFNLYEILNLPYNCTINDVRSKFKKLVKKFHPDKITELEEKIYYYITLAHHVLTNIESRSAYDTWLLQNTNQEIVVENNSNEREDMDKYFPSNYSEASRSFNRDEESFKQRHGLYDEDSRAFSERYTDKVSQLKQLGNIKKENFRNMKEFNSVFDNRLQSGGEYHDNIIVYNKEDQIINHQQNSNNLKYVSLKDFNKMYSDDTIIGSYYTSVDIAYKLQPRGNIRQHESLDNAINNYNTQTNTLYKTHDNDFNNFDI